jgi:hypothetical protein
MKRFICALFFVFVFQTAALAVTPIKLSLWDNVAAPPDTDVMGVEIGIGTRFNSLHGVAVNIMYARIDNVAGLSNSIVNMSRHVIGVQMGPVNFTQSAEGKGFIRGAQLGAVNIADETEGAQIGFVNIAANAHGLQLGAVNFTQNMRGVQVGLLNFIQNSTLPFMVFFNGRF